MPRLVRLDVPGVLHHVMGRGIEDRNDFIAGLGARIPLRSERFPIVSGRRDDQQTIESIDKRTSTGFAPLGRLTRKIAEPAISVPNRRRLILQPVRLC